MKRRVLAVAAVASCLVVAITLFASRGEDNRRAPARRITLGSDAADLWPASRSWVWNVDPIATKRRIGLCVRTTESPIRSGAAPFFPAVPELPAKGAERHSGWSGTGNQLSGRVTCQLIDFREVGLGEAVGRQPLRLLVRLRVGGEHVGITGSESVLVGETFAAASEVEARWANDELHLLTVYTRTADVLFAHHVLVQQSDGE